MALFKEIVNENGITARYHRIHSVIINGGLLGLTVRSYSDSKYREMDINEQELNMIYSKPERDESDMKRVAELVDSFKGPSYVFETHLYMPIEIGMSFSDVYQKLKKMDPFKDAEDA